MNQNQCFRLRRFRFGNQALLLLILVAAVAFGWLRYANQQEKVLEQAQDRSDRQEALLDVYRDAEKTVGAYGSVPPRTSTTVDEFIAKLQQATDPNAPYELVRSLPKPQRPLALPFLVDLCKDGRETQRRNAVTALGEIGVFDEVVTAALVGATADSDPGVRCFALSAMSKAKTQAVKATFNKALKDDNAFVQIEAAKALCEIGEEKTAVSALIPLLESDEPSVVDGAFSAFVEKRISPDVASNAVPALIKHVDSSRWETRLGALFALYYVGSRERVVELLLDATEDPVKAVRQEAAKLLRRLDAQDPLTRPK